MTTNQPESVNDRLTHLENRFDNMTEVVAAQSNTIDVLVANILQLTENVNNLTINVNNLTINVSNLTIKVDNLTEQAAQDRAQAAQDRAQAAQDRQQAAIDRQEFRNEIQRIWEYLRDRNGGSSPPN
jgi:chromosome segregation ATPase